MPKATLEFNLPDESEEFRSATDAVKWELLAYKFDNWLRSQIKYCSDDDYSEDGIAALEKCRAELNRLAWDQGLEI